RTIVVNYGIQSEEGRDGSGDSGCPVQKGGVHDRSKWWSSVPYRPCLNRRHNFPYRHGGHRLRHRVGGISAWACNDLRSSGQIIDGTRPGGSTTGAEQLLSAG